MTQNNLGNALQSLATRKGDTGRLEEAVEAYRVALEERTRARVPLDWAATQNNLGAALLTLGERENSTAHLEQAAEAYHATAHLEQAVEAYRAALEERTRARALEERTRGRVPLDWAATQDNLGSALRALGERESGTAHLDNLGSALFQIRALGERESGTAHLEQAVEAYRAALEERTRARVPLDWAMTQNNLGNALAALGERERGTERLEQAVAAYRATLEVFADDGPPAYRDIVQDNIAHTLKMLNERRGTPGLPAEPD